MPGDWLISVYGFLRGGRSRHIIIITIIIIIIITIVRVFYARDARPFCMRYVLSTRTRVHRTNGILPKGKRKPILYELLIIRHGRRTVYVLSVESAAILDARNTDDTEKLVFVVHPVRMFFFFLNIRLSLESPSLKIIAQHF